MESLKPELLEAQMLAVTKHRVVRGPTSKLYRSPEEYSRNATWSAFCVFLRENAIISVILQPDCFFCPATASPVHGVSCHVVHVAIRLVPQA